MKEDKKNYICAVPFTSIEVQDYSRFLCCASWLKKYLPDNSSPKDAWNSKEANDIRESILDGSYKYCDELHCPFLRQLKFVGKVGRVPPLYHREEIPSELQKKITQYKEGTLTPSIIQFSFDRTCNYNCPSCRVEIFTANKKKIAEVQATIEEIQEQYGDTVEYLYITGSGDPFISVGFRNFLRNFDSSKFPKVERIHLHTNASMWTPKMWESMPNIHRLVRSCEISIDAATKDTYENKVRLGGNWDKLMENLRFISSLPNLTQVKLSFVVQAANYREMPSFYKLMKEIFGKKASIFFGKITNWGTYTQEEFKHQEIWNPEHPEHQEFIKLIRETLPANQAWTNLQEFLVPQNKLL
jgi:wyosine [tRNA(Phe)-imidazoG37] synthetase (radical SAM superfamily)